MDERGQIGIRMVEKGSCWSGGSVMMEGRRSGKRWGKNEEVGGRLSCQTMGKAREKDLAPIGC